MATAPNTTAVAALETLACLFSRSDYITTLITGQNRPPCLVIALRHGALSEDIYATGSWYWHAHAERIAPTSDPHAAATAIACALSADPHAGPAKTTAGQL